ncbi:translation initiation factor IF-2 [Anaerobranca californiensis DSM 14826]|uniref:Translation initiation factor IF-2 n=1 Tax=Anaerobranca californiensis DSM 14826 TaxID=1120989 RepID=A0A1M6KET0_9FIRM|nr:translation initiation factor IF-2 [Anaerobranca californiensis]SHJ57347.1 translation initiation factor IF-2 [Anaerobranca californiensis DSM 14826]
MSKFRVYELAKDLNITSKELIKKMEELNIPVKNHMSSINDDDFEKIYNYFNRKEQSIEEIVEVNKDFIDINGDIENNFKKKNKKGKKDKKKKNKNLAEKEARTEKDDSMSKIIKLTEDQISVGELAKKLGESPANIIKKLMGLGIMAGVNQKIELETAELIAFEFGYEIELEKEEEEDEVLTIEQDDPKDLKERHPVVTVLGHVDHGKTTLLDTIRHTNVTKGEAGGITQHIGAYQVNVNGKKITFIDTPGHAAFTAMRARGAKVTDIAILVVAADDGVMPQTVEALNHAKAANVPIIVAVNKMDKPTANPDRVKQELVNYGLVPEEWGGDTIFVPISALKGEGIDNLLEIILLVAEVQELKANPDAPASGTVIESKLDKGRGPVATVLVQRGTLKIGDSVVCGTAYGKVRAMINDQGKQIKKAGPSTPVEILGLSEVPIAGEIFKVVQDDKLARTIAEKNLQKSKEAAHKKNTPVTLDELFQSIKEGELKELNIILKADVQGSVEALKHSLERLSNEEVRVKVIHSGVGAINENDVTLASASGAIIIGFNVRPDQNAKKLNDELKVDIRLYRIIYNVIEDVEAAIKGMLAPKLEEVVLGSAEIRQIFRASKIGNIAGCYVVNGVINRNAKARLIRDGVVIYEGSFNTLKRFKDDVKEVQQGFECGIVLEKFNDIKEGDIIECFTMKEMERE